MVLNLDFIEQQRCSIFPDHGSACGTMCHWDHSFFQEQETKFLVEMGIHFRRGLCPIRFVCHCSGAETMEPLAAIDV